MIFSDYSSMRTFEKLDFKRIPITTQIWFSMCEPYERANIKFWNQIEKDRQEGEVVKILSQNESQFSIQKSKQIVQVDTSNLDSIRSIFKKGSDVLIDISGVDYNFWAACVFALRCHVNTLALVYTEPVVYKNFIKEKNLNKPSAAYLFGLSEKSLGIKPLPGFTKLKGPARDQKTLLVALLGFEGDRALRILNEFDGIPSRVIPVIGMPGYQVEFPAYTISCNKEFFKKSDSSANCRWVAADDPFEVRRELISIKEEFSDHYMYIAPVGTRPHTLGALLFAIDNRDSEILFDHPVRTKKSRKGTGKSHFYKVF